MTKTVKLWIESGLGLGLVMGLAGCGSPCAERGVTRCSGSIVEVCGSGAKWQRVMDCAEAKPGAWACTSGAGGCTCIKTGPGTGTGPGSESGSEPGAGGGVR